MSDPQFNALAGQVSVISAQIQSEQCARMVADEALASRVTASEAAIAAVKLQIRVLESGAASEKILLGRRLDGIEKAYVGPIQSSNYVPGVSGWKLEKDGTFEINACILGSAAQAPERQMVSVEVASWSKYDLPKNAANLLQFMQAELERVPEEYRHAAEFEEFDASYGDEQFNGRLFLSYSRLETEEELADRLEKAKVAGTHISIKNGQMTVTQDGVVRFKIGNINQPEPVKPQPFKVDGDQVFINETFLHDASITNAKIVPGGKLYAGTGLGSIIDPSRFEIASQHPELGRAFIAGDASNILDLLKGQIEVDNLGEALRDRIDKIYETVNEKVKEVIRSELRPGGLLHR
ncbi:phage tail tip fiber protein [Pseudomonas carnis]|uniref:Tip attachment protein J central straight fiber domain-containing protein n=1 Tax=Pseudomonas carnis TaxID=2487355 RepID=A0ABT5RKR9_9PSED|nr:hypothetical protein [Pseudomonas carnis]MDD1946032.1 hypothetical protein [Pseudomonas carnis]